MTYAPHAILGVDVDASDAEIKSAWKSLAQLYHPDKCPDDPFAASRFKQAKEAYEVLMDPDRRARMEKGEDPKRHNSMAMARDCIFRALEKQLHTRGVKSIITGIKQFMQGEQNEFRTKLAGIKQQVDVLEDCTDKFKYTGEEENLIEGAILGQLRKGREALRNAELQLEASELATIMIEDYEDIEELMASNHIMYTNTSSTTTG